MCVTVSLARRGGRDIKRNIAKRPLMERTWFKINSSRSSAQLLGNGASRREKVARLRYSPNSLTGTSKWTVFTTPLR